MTNNKDRVYCVSLAFDVLLETLKCCFPLDQISGSQSPSAVAKGEAKKEEKPEIAKKKVEKQQLGEKKKLKRKSASLEEEKKQRTPLKRRCQRAKSYNLGEGREDGDGSSWTEEE